MKQCTCCPVHRLTKEDVKAAWMTTTEILGPGAVGIPEKAFSGRLKRYIRRLIRSRSVEEAMQDAMLGNMHRYRELKRYQ